MDSSNIKKVVILYRFLPQYRKEFYILLREKLATQNIRLELVYGKTPNNPKNDEIDLPWAIYRKNYFFGFGYYKFIWQNSLDVIKDADLVIVEQANKLLINYYLFFARYLFKHRKLAFWGHGLNMQAEHNSFTNRIKRHLLSNCDWWFAYTESVKNYIQQNSTFPADRITVVQNAIDTKSLRSYRSELSEEEIDSYKKTLNIESNNIAIYCGGIYKEKKIDFLIEAIDKVKLSIPDFYLIVIGSGPDSFKFIDASISRPWIKYLGSKFGKDKVLNYCISKITLMPGLVGLTILDSFTLASPLFTTKYPYHSPEIEYLQNGVNGVITDQDTDSFANAIIDILSNETKYLKLKENANLSSTKYTVENMVSNFAEGIVHSLLK